MTFIMSHSFSIRTLYPLIQQPLPAWYQCSCSQSLIVHIWSWVTIQLLQVSLLFYHLHPPTLVLLVSTLIHLTTTLFTSLICTQTTLRICCVSDELSCERCCWRESDLCELLLLVCPALTQLRRYLLKTWLHSLSCWIWVVFLLIPEMIIMTSLSFFIVLRKQ